MCNHLEEICPCVPDDITNPISHALYSMASWTLVSWDFWWVSGDVMMTSSNGNIFRVTGHLCGEFTGHRWIPRTKASDAELWWFFICAWINCWVNNAQAGDLRRHRAHYDVTLMLTGTHTCCQRNGMSIVHLTIVPDDLLNRLNYLKVADFDWYREHAYISDV